MNSIDTLTPKLQSSSDENATPTMTRQEGRIRTGKKRILAVDDQASNTRLVKLYLERTDDYVVREENNPQAALAAAEQFQPHLILLDVMMPGLDGGDLAACFQANPRLKAVPIVFLTAAITKGEVEESGGQVGGHSFLAKPVVLPEMLACIRHHLGE
jgi:CheY-like chemotaxis protein